LDEHVTDDNFSFQGGSNFQLDKQDVQSVLTDEWIRIDVQDLAGKADTANGRHFELD
jgi:hypothetical protein